MKVPVCLCMAFLAVLVAMAEGTGYKCDGRTETIFCESKGSKRTKCNCNLGPIKSAELIYEKSNYVCKKFKTWGWFDNYIWVSDCCAAKFKVCVEVKKPCDGKKVYQECASKSYKHTECGYNNGFIKCVDLIKEDSHNKCKENVTWGYTETYIWTDRGCDAKFLLCAKDKKCKDKEVEQSCGSKGSKRNTCSCNVGKILSVKLLKENSHDKCLEGKTWYFTENYIWVDDGCDARFKICVREEPCYGKKVYKECISKNYKHRDCDYNNGIIKSARILKEVSNRKCYPKKTWGYTSSSVWVDKGCGAQFLFCAKDIPCDGKKVFQSCASKYSKRNTCSCDVGKIKSVKFVSGDTKKCLEGKTWFFTEDYVWVDDGCSAKFELCVKEKCADVVITTCTSYGNKRKECGCHGGPIKKVELIKQLTHDPCIENKTWGYDRKNIWVSGCCSGKFKICIDHKY